MLLNSSFDEVSDSAVIAKQIDRPLSTRALAVYRCRSGFPVVTQNAAISANGSPFPTLYWLTCPQMRRNISRLEAAGLISQLQEELDLNPALQIRLLESDAKYREIRDRSMNPVGFLFGGIAGCRNIFKLKCLHAHAADWLAAELNPIGEQAVALEPVPTDCRRCEDL